MPTPHGGGIYEHGSSNQNRDPDNPGAVFDAQSWAAQARSYAGALQFVLAAMEATAQELEKRITQQAGGNPDEGRERPDLAKHLGTRRAVRVRGEAANGLVAGLDVDPGIAVGQRLHPERPSPRRAGAAGSLPARCRRDSSR